MHTSTETPRTPALPARRGASCPRDLGSVVLGGGFLGDWQRLNSTATIPHVIAHLEDSGVLDNFRRLLGETDAPFRGPVFSDSDLYKTLEALGWEAVGGRHRHGDFVAEATRLITGVQDRDGYLNTSFQGPRRGERFSDMIESHELYCLGHLIQAAVAWHYAGDDTLLHASVAYADLLYREFGPGKRDAICGHPQIETALVELARVTRDDRYRQLALRMIDLRGHDTLGSGYFGGHYYQDLVPVRDADQAVGHAVRQLYLLTGVADVAADRDDPGLDAALDRVWEDIHERKLYITGGLGSRHRGESFGDPYELPSDRAYSESCAAIANFHWNWRMVLSRGDAKYADEMERGLYNAIAASTSIDGTAFFYSNPLQLRSGHSHEVDAPSRRLDWYYCACCPPNVARLLASIGSFITSVADGVVYFHLYADGEYELEQGQSVTIRTDYPWSPTIEFEFSSPVVAPVRLRIPGWSQQATLIAGDTSVLCVSGEYAEIPAGTSRAVLTIPLPAVLIDPHPRVDAIRGTVAVTRGPIVYCLEEADLPHDTVVEDIVVGQHATLADAGLSEELGVPVVSVGSVEAVDAGSLLYRPLVNRSDSARVVDDLQLIPYFRWANRTDGAMRVWIPNR